MLTVHSLLAYVEIKLTSLCSPLRSTARCGADAESWSAKASHSKPVRILDIEKCFNVELGIISNSGHCWCVIKKLLRTYVSWSQE